MTKETIRHKLRKADIYLGDCPVAGHPSVYWAAETDDNKRHLECGSCLATTTEEIDEKPQTLKEWAEATAQRICWQRPPLDK